MIHLFVYHVFAPLNEVDSAKALIYFLQNENLTLHNIYVDNTYNHTESYYIY